MVRATIIVSALVALVATVSAVPHGSVADFDYIGTGDIKVKDVLNGGLVNANNLKAQDIAQDISVLGGSGCGRRGRGCRRDLSGLRKRAAPVADAPQVIKIARKAGSKPRGKKLNSKANQAAKTAA